MPNKTLFVMKKELSAHNISFADESSPAQIKELFGTLPISTGQIRELKLLGIDYKEKWHWTRKTASDFIKDSADYVRLRNLLPASPKQRILLMEHGIVISKETTGAEASRLINELPATQAQLNYFAKNNLKISSDKPLTFGYAQQIIARRERRFLEYKLNTFSKEQ